MKLSNSSSVPVYTVSGASTARPLPEWLSQQRKRSLKKDPEYANRIELLQDFGFEEASQCVRISDDGEWVMSTGTYKPQIHTHYLPDLSLSYARHTNTINKTFLLLSSDYTKSAHLQEDRSVEFHTPHGCHYALRIPRYGRDLVYSRSAAELLVPAVGVNANGLGEVFRINLELGRFMREYEVDVGGDDIAVGANTFQGGVGTGAVNAAAVAEESHNLNAFGTSIGTVEFWDPRSRGRAGRLGIPEEQESGGQRPEVTALEFHRGGITTAVGTSSGMIYLYDLRSPLPLLRKDHGYGYPVQTVKFLTSSTRSRMQTDEPRILSADKRILKIWDQRDGSPWTSVEPTVDINCVTWCQDSGMFLTANEGRQQHAFFIPQLGPAPRWCSFLDNVVEEMAEDPNDPNAYSGQRSGEIYDNYKFLTLPQLQALSLDHLVGKGNLLRPYMHGYFVAQRLYEEAKLIANPSSWEEERAKRVRERIEKERESRIRGKKQVTAKVNRRTAEKILEREEKAERRRAQRAIASSAADKSQGQIRNESNGLLEDSRFSRLFQDDDFAIDETSREFQSLNPSTKPAVASNQDHEKPLTAVEQEMIDDAPGSSTDEAGDVAEQPVSAERREIPSYRRSTLKKKSQKTEMKVLSSQHQHKPSRDRSFGSRVFKTKPGKKAPLGSVSRRNAVGEKTLSFEPQSGKKNMAQAQPEGRVNNGSKERRSASGNTFRRM